MNTVSRTSIVSTEKGTKILISNFTKHYIGKFVMQIDGKKRLKRIEKALDKSLIMLDNLRCKTEEEEKIVLALLREQRMLSDKQH